MPAAFLEAQYEKISHIFNQQSNGIRLSAVFPSYTVRMPNIALEIRAVGSVSGKEHSNL